MVNMHLIFSVFCDYHTSGIPHLGLEIGHRRRRRHRPARHTQAAIVELENGKCNGGLLGPGFE